MTERTVTKGKFHRIELPPRGKQCRSVVAYDRHYRCQQEIGHDGPHVHQGGDAHLWWRYTWTKDYATEYESGGDD